jgi:hypothetical protein
VCKTIFSHLKNEERTRARWSASKSKGQGSYLHPNALNVKQLNSSQFDFPSLDPAQESLRSAGQKLEAENVEHVRECKHSFIFLRSLPII